MYSLDADLDVRENLGSGLDNRGKAKCKLTNKISAEARKLILDDLILIGHITGGQYVVVGNCKTYGQI